MPVDFKIKIIKGNITKVEVDAIVNAANSSLLGGGGVDGAIHRSGGPAILEACEKIRDKQGKCKTGEAVITTAGRLPAKFVIHTVGPVWVDGKKDEEDKLADCYSNSLALAVLHDCKTIAFPNISTGIYGFPKALAAKVCVATVRKFLSANDKIDLVTFVCFDEENFLLLEAQMAEG